jgi:hypothetical protein
MAQGGMAYRCPNNQHTVSVRNNDMRKQSAMKVPLEVRGVLGKLFDREVAWEFGVSTQTVQLWRTSMGIAPVCKACRLAVREGRTNTCSSHSDLGASRRAEAKAKWAHDGATFDELMQQYQAVNERACSVGKRLELLLQHNPNERDDHE